MDYRPPGSSFHGILQERILEWVAIPFSSSSSPPRDRTQVSRTADRFFIIWTTRLNPNASLLLKGPWDRCVLQNLAFKSRIIQFINFWKISGHIKKKSWHFTSRVTFQILGFFISPQKPCRQHRPFYAFSRPSALSHFPVSESIQWGSATSLSEHSVGLLLGAEVSLCFRLSPLEGTPDTTTDLLSCCLAAQAAQQSAKPMASVFSQRDPLWPPLPE